MKKTLIALAVVAASSAGVAHAALENFAPGTLDRTVNIGGMISKSDMSGKWEWAVGTGLNHYQSTTKDVEQIDDKWQLSITNTGNKPILVGRTTEAFSAPSIGGYAAIPQIALSDSNGNIISMSYEGAKGSNNNAGKYYFDLPVSSSNGQSLGSVRVHATVAAVVGLGDQVETNGRLESIFANDNKTVIFSGGMGLWNNGIIKDATQAASVAASFGAPSVDDLLAQLQAKNANITSLTPGSSPVTENMFYDDTNVVAAGYGLGIADGDRLDVTFDNAVTEATQWTAPLHITVSYI